MERESDGNKHQTDEMDLLYDDVLDSDRNSESQTEMEFSSRSEDTKTSNLDESFDLYGDLSTDPYGSSYTETNTDRDTTLESTALENTIEELDLYDDILTEEDAEQKQSYDEKCTQYESAVKLIEKLQTENKKLKENLMKQTTLSKNVKTNMSSLLVTARGELNRKDREIKKLRSKPTFLHRTYTPGHRSGQETQRGDREYGREMLVKGKDTDEATKEREESGEKSDNSKQSRKGKTDRSVNSRYEKDVFGRTRFNDNVKTGKEDKLNIITKDNNKTDRVSAKKHGDSSDNCDSSKQRKSTIENTKRDKQGENKRYEPERNDHHRKKNERSELINEKQDRDKKDNERRKNEKDMPRKEKEHERKSEKTIRERKDEREIRERKDEREIRERKDDRENRERINVREIRERNIKEDKFSKEKERQSDTKTKERDNDKDENITSRIGNRCDLNVSETSSNSIPPSLDVGKIDQKVPKPLNSDCKVLDLREKLKQKRKTSGNKSTSDNVAETVEVKSTQIDTDRITGSILHTIGSADKRDQLNEQNVIANKQKLNKEQESHNILKDREFLQSLKCNVRQKDLLKVTLDSNTNKDKSISIQRKPIVFTSNSEVTSKSDVRYERDVVDYDDFSPCSNSLLKSPVLKETDDIIERDIRKNTECQPVISYETALTESVELLNKDMPKDTSATKNISPQHYGPTDNVSVEFESAKTQNRTPDVSANENNKLESCVDNDKTLNTFETHTNVSLIVEQINADLLNTIPIEETSGKKMNKSAMESKVDEMLSPKDRDEKENKAERRASSEKRRRHAYRRVISETISSVTSCDKSPSVEEFLKNLRKECVSTDNVSTCTSLSNVQSDCDMRHRSEGSVVHDELNISDNKRTTLTKDDKLTEVMTRKMFCSKDGCSIKVNHLHPKSELNTGGLQTSPPEDIQKKYFKDPDDKMIASEIENTSINEKDMQSVRSLHSNDTSDSESDDSTSNSEMSQNENDIEMSKTEQFSEVVMEAEKKNILINNMQNECQESVLDSSKLNNSLCYEKEIVTNSNSNNKIDTDTYTIQKDLHLKMSDVRRDTSLQHTNVLETLNSPTHSSQDVINAERVGFRKRSSENESSSDSEDDSSYTGSGSGSSYSSSDSSGEESTSERDSVIKEVHLGETLLKSSTTINAPTSLPNNACNEENGVTNEVQICLGNRVQNDEISKIPTPINDRNQTSVQENINKNIVDKHNSSCNSETGTKQHEKGIAMKVLEHNFDKQEAYKYTGLKQKDEGNEEIVKDSVTEGKQSKVPLIAKTNEPTRKDYDLNDTLAKSVVTNPINNVSPDRNTSLQDKSFLLESLLCGIASVVNQKKEDERFLKKTLYCMNKDVSKSEETKNKSKVIKGSSVQTNNKDMGKLKLVSETISETIVEVKDTDNICPPSKYIDTDGKNDLSQNVDGENKSTYCEIHNYSTDVASDVNNPEINKMATTPDKDWKPQTDSHVSESNTPKKEGNMDIYCDKTIETSIFGSTLSLSSDESPASSSSGSESDSDSMSGSSSGSESSSYTSDSESSPEFGKTKGDRSQIKSRECSYTVDSGVALDNKRKPAPEIYHEKKTNISALESIEKSTRNATEDKTNEKCDRNTIQAVNYPCKVSDKTTSAFVKSCNKKSTPPEQLLATSECVGREVNEVCSNNSFKAKAYEDKPLTESKTMEKLVTNDKVCKDKTVAITANISVSNDTKPPQNDQSGGTKCNNGYMVQDEMPKFLCETPVQETISKKMRKIGKKDVNFVQSSPVITISNNKIVSTEICDSVAKKTLDSGNKECLASKTYQDNISRYDKSVKEVKENVNDKSCDKVSNGKGNKDTCKDKTEDIKGQKKKSPNHVPSKRSEIKSTRLSPQKNINAKNSQADARKVSSESVDSIETDIDKEREKEMTLRLVGLSSASSKLSQKTNTFIMSPSERGNSNRKVNKKVLSSEKQKTSQPKFPVVASKSDKSVTGSILRLVSKSNERLKEKTGNEEKSKLASPKKKRIKTPPRENKKSIALNSDVKKRVKLTFEHEQLADHRDPAKELTENLAKIAAHHERVKESRTTKKPLFKVKSPPLKKSRKETVVSSDSETDCDLAVKEKYPLSKVQASHTDNLRKKRRILSGSEKDSELRSSCAKSSSKPEIPSIEMIKRTANISSDTEDYDVDRLTHYLKVNSESDKRNRSISDNRSVSCVKRSHGHGVRHEETLTKDKNKSKGNDLNNAKELQSFEDLIENYEKHLVNSHKTRKVSKHSESNKAIQKHCSENLPRQLDKTKSVNCDSATGSSLKNKSNHVQKSIPSRNKNVQSSKGMNIEKKQEHCQKEANNSLNIDVVKTKVNRVETKSEKAKHDIGDKAEHDISDTLTTDTDTDESGSEVESEDNDSMVRAIFGSSESSGGRKSKSVSSSERQKCSSAEKRKQSSKKEGDITINLEEKLKQLYASTRLERENMPKHRSKNTSKGEKIIKILNRDEKSSTDSTKSSKILKSLSPMENQKKGQMDKMDVKVKEPEKENEKLGKYEGKSITAFILDDADTLDGIDYEDDLSFGLEETAAFDKLCSDNEGDTMPVNDSTENPIRKKQFESPEDGEVSSDSDCVDKHIELKDGDRIKKKSVSYFRNKANDHGHIEKLKNKNTRPKILLRSDKAFSPIKFPSSADSPNTQDGRGYDSSSYKRESQAKRKRCRSDSNSSIEAVETFGIPTRKSNRPTVKENNYRVTPDAVDKKQARRSPRMRKQRSRSPNVSTRQRSKSPQGHSSRRSRSVSPRRHKTSTQEKSSSRSKRRSRSGSYDKSKDNYRRHRERNRDQNVTKMSSNGSSSEENINESRVRRAGDKISKQAYKRERSNSMSSCYDSPKDVSKHRQRRGSNHQQSGSDSEGRYRHRAHSNRYKQGNSNKNEKVRKNLRQELTHISRKDSSFSKDRHSSKYSSSHKRRYVSSSDDEYVLVKKTELLKRRRSERSVTPTVFDSEHSNEDDRISKDLHRKKNSSEKENVSSPFGQKKGNSSHRTLKR